MLLDSGAGACYMSDMAVEIVGRDSELGEISAFLERQGSLPGVLILQGDAGIGKTTLWRAGVDVARDLSYQVLVTRPTSTEASMPFTGLGDLLGGYADEILVQLAPPQRAALEAAMLLGAPVGPPPQPRTIAMALLSSLRALSTKAPVLVAVDDVQWLDASTAAALEFTLRRLDGSMPVAVLLSWRTNGPAPGPLGTDRVPDVSVTRAPVGPLSLGALHRMLAARLGRPLPRPVLVRVHDVSGGNPFFALQLAEVLERRGLPSTRGELPLPPSVADALRERLDVLPDDTRDALLVVASLAAPTLDVIEDALGPAARSLLQPGIAAGLLVPESDLVRFAHPLTRSAVYSEAWPARRRHWHRRLAEVVADPDERARHLALAVEGPNHEVARILEDAAHRARLRGAPAGAALLAEQSRRATPPEDADDVWRRGLLAAEYHMQSGDLERFRTLVRELLSLSTAGDQRSHVYALLSLAARRAEAVSLLERALEEAESTRQRQSVLSDLVAVTTLGGNVEAGARHAQEALRLADELDDAEAVADALALVAATEQVLGRGLRRDLLERADALAVLRKTDSMHETTGIVRNAFNWAAVLSTADEFEDARTRLEAAGRLIEEQELAQHLPELLRTRADLECWAGNWDIAWQHVEGCEDAADQTGQPSKREDVVCARAFVAAHRGDVDDARSTATAGLARAEEAGSLRAVLRHLAVLGFVELSLADHAAALPFLERAAAAAAAGGFVEPGRSRFHGDLAEALIGAGRLGEAQFLVEWLERSAHETSYPWTVATAARCRGLLLAAGGDVDGAARALSVALAAHERLGNPFERARTLLALGMAQRRGKRRTQARDTLAQALAVFDELRARLWADRARQELARIPGRRSADDDTLTEAEQRIAALVAEGLSNKEVASTLFLSVKTVEVTLTRVYRKLGVHSRAELAHVFTAAAKD